MTAQKAAVYLAEGRTERWISKELKCARDTLRKWRATVEFVALIDAATKEFTGKILSTGAAVKANRIQSRQRRIDAITRGIEARAGNPQRGGASWDDSGLFTQRKKKLGDFLVTEFNLDTAAVSALLAHEEAIAIEVGDWKEKAKAPDTGKPYELSDAVRKTLRALTPEQIKIAMERAAAQEHKPENGSS